MLKVLVLLLLEPSSFLGPWIVVEHREVLVRFHERRLAQPEELVEVGGNHSVTVDHHRRTWRAGSETKSLHHHLTANAWNKCLLALEEQLKAKKCSKLAKIRHKNVKDSKSKVIKAVASINKTNAKIAIIDGKSSMIKTAANTSKTKAKISLKRR